MQSMWSVEIAAVKEAIGRKTPTSGTQMCLDLIPRSEFPISLQRFFSGFAGANPDRVVQCRDEDFAIADLSGLRRAHDGFDDTCHDGLGHGQLELYLGYEVD